MDKPSWINQVKEVDVEEMEVLVRLGVKVWHDYADSPDWWDSSPFLRQVQGPEDLFYAKISQSKYKSVVFYVALGSED